LISCWNTRKLIQPRWGLQLILCITIMNMTVAFIEYLTLGILIIKDNAITSFCKIAHQLLWLCITWPSFLLNKIGLVLIKEVLLKRSIEIRKHLLTFTLMHQTLWTCLNILDMLTIGINMSLAHILISFDIWVFLTLLSLI
jgi:hypothetical protein